MGVGTREKIGKEDFDFHNPANGTAAQTFNRTTSTGGTTPITKISAQDIPLRDAVTVAGALTPFEALADTAAAKNVELALADVRRNISTYKNFEYYGGSTVNDAATAIKNTEVFQKIVTDIIAEGREGAGIYFPGRIYRFKESGGSMPTINGVSNVTLVGAGFGTLLQRETSANTALNLFTFIDCPGLRIVDIGIDRNGIVGFGNAVHITNSAVAEIGNLYILNTRIVGGASNVSISPAAASSATHVWISGNFFDQASAANVSLQSSQSVHVLSNNYGVTGTGLSITSSGGGGAVLGDIEINGNVHLGTNSDINIMRIGVWAAIHKGVTISNNKMTAGDILVQGVDDVGMFTNNLYSGRISVILDMATSKNLRILDNNVNGAVGNGIAVTGISCTLTGFQIHGGTVSNATQRGILLQFNGAVARGGTIKGVSVIDCSRQDGGVGTDFSGIVLDPAGSAIGGVQDSIIEGNIIRCYSVTAPSGNMHNYAVEEVAGGASNRNMIGPNFTKGYIQATENLVTGAASLDVVAAVTVAVATYARFDGGAAV